eukprot:scaffold72664_cov35-Tisochrysis_lutea.AAC.2
MLRQDGRLYDDCCTSNSYRRSSNIAQLPGVLCHPRHTHLLGKGEEPQTDHLSGAACRPRLFLLPAVDGNTTYRQSRSRRSAVLR